MVKRLLLAIFLLGVSGLVARAEKYSVVAGTILHCRLSQTISTKLNYQGDPFLATVSEPLIINGHDVIPAGTTLEGRIVQLQRPGRVKGVGEMRLTAGRITLPDGRGFPVSAVLVTAYGAEGVKVSDEEGTVKGPRSRLRDLQEVGLGMGGGGFLGTLIGGFHGAVIGGAVGGAAGFVDTLRRRGKDLTLPTGTELKYQLTRPLEVYH